MNERNNYKSIVIQWWDIIDMYRSEFDFSHERVCVCGTLMNHMTLRVSELFNMHFIDILFGSYAVAFFCCAAAEIMF